MASLALKYRPQNFHDLVGQLHAAQSLKNAIEHKQIGQAYLFFGSRGVGKTSTARILAKALNCATGPTTEICGKCEFCTEITSGHCTDVYEMDAASNRGIEHIRNLREAVRFPPIRARYKIYIIDEVHMLSADAFNALLKTLEEPPGHAIFILATTEKHKVPETILSRCQSYDFRKFTLEEIQNRLAYILKTENTDFEQAALLPIAEKAEGSMRDAISLLDQVLAFSGNQKITADKARLVLGILPDDTFLGFLEAIKAHDIKKLLNVIAEIHNSGGNLKRFTWDFLALVKDVLVVKEGAFSADGNADKERLHKLQAAAAIWDAADLTMIFEHFFKIYSGWTFYHTARSNEIKISFEVALVDAINKLKSPSLAGLIKKMESLKRAIEDGGAPLQTSTETGEKKKSELSAFQPHQVLPDVRSAVATGQGIAPERKSDPHSGLALNQTTETSKPDNDSVEKGQPEKPLGNGRPDKEIESILMHELLAEEGSDPYLKDLFK